MIMPKDCFAPFISCTPAAHQWWGPLRARHLQAQKCVAHIYTVPGMSHTLQEAVKGACLYVACTCSQTCSTSEKAGLNTFQ